MKTARAVIYALVAAFLFDVAIAAAENRPAGMREDVDGILEIDEYRVISMNGAVTRRPCPYSCEMRGIPREQCKEWRSRKGDECYVQDTSRPTGAIVARDSADEPRAAYR